MQWQHLAAAVPPEDQLPAKLILLLAISLSLPGKKSFFCKLRLEVLWRDAHLVRSKFTAENFYVARSESGELSRDGHRPSTWGLDIIRMWKYGMQQIAIAIQTIYKNYFERN